MPAAGRSLPSDQPETGSPRPVTRGQPAEHFHPCAGACPPTNHHRADLRLVSYKYFPMLLMRAPSACRCVSLINKSDDIQALIEIALEEFLHSPCSFPASQMPHSANAINRRALHFHAHCTRDGGKISRTSGIKIA